MENLTRSRRASLARRLRVVDELTLEKLERIIEAISRHPPEAVAFRNVTFGQLQAMALAAKETLEERVAESGLDTAHHTMAQFLERQDG